MRRLVASCLIVFALLAIVAGIFVYNQGRDSFDTPGPHAKDVVLIIPRGATVRGIAERLEKRGVIANSLIFRLAARLFEAEQDMKAGEFAFPARASMREVMKILREGDVVGYRLTIPEGLTSEAIVALVNDAPVLTGKIEAIPSEGTLLPETYHYVRGDGRSTVMARIEGAMTQALADAWRRRAEGSPLKSPYEALVLASIVERETGIAEERTLVAGVFINRLRKGMRLQSDPTVIYGLTLGQGPLGRPLSRKDLAQPTLYNTYTIDALPPGPIANPGRDSIEAVLHPADTPFLYFVADGTGGHVFAATLAEHNKNVANWRKIEKARRQASGGD